MFLNSFNHFRAISIVLIVVGHCFGLAGINFQNYIEKTFFNIVSGGTGLFVFISGFLFFHVFSRNFSYKVFVFKKIKTILVPYLVLGLIPISFYLLQIFSHRPYNYGFFLNALYSLIKDYASGAILNGYWYIPFILIVFLLSPAHNLFIKCGNSFQVLIIVVLSIVSMLIHRPINNINVLQSVLYYTPVYLFGIWCSINKEIIYKRLFGYEILLLLLLLLIAMTDISYGHLGNYHKYAFQFAGIDFMYIQKVIMCLFLMLFLNRFENVNNRILSILADTSFAIFFIHPIIIWVINMTGIKKNLVNPWIVLLFISMFVVAASVMIAKILNKLLLKKSRYFIGY